MPNHATPDPVILPADAIRLGRALTYAAEHHGGQARKGTTIPYVSHLLHVAGFVLEHGGSVDQAIAGLLHDLIEDCGVTREEIERQFGAEIASIVKACTDLLEGDTPDKKSDWEPRKRHYIDHIASAPKAAVLVSACDKRHNLAAIVADVRRHGIGYLDRFTGRPHQQLWYYRAFREAVRNRIPRSLDEDLGGLIEELSRLLDGEQSRAEPQRDTSGRKEKGGTRKGRLPT